MRIFDIQNSSYDSLDARAMDYRTHFYMPRSQSNLHCNGKLFGKMSQCKLFRNLIVIMEILVWMVHEIITTRKKEMMARRMKMNCMNLSQQHFENIKNSIITFICAWMVFADGKAFVMVAMHIWRKKFRYWQNVQRARINDNWLRRSDRENEKTAEKLSIDVMMQANRVVLT